MGKQSWLNSANFVPFKPAKLVKDHKWEETSYEGVDYYYCAKCDSAISKTFASGFSDGPITEMKLNVILWLHCDTSKLECPDLKG